MTSKQIQDNRWIALIIAAIIVLTFGLFYRDFETIVHRLIAFSGAIIGIILIFGNLRWFYLLLIGLVPYSIDMVAVGNAKMSFPSEIMLIAIFPITLMFNTAYRKTLLRVLRHPIAWLLCADLMIQLLTSLTGTQIDVSLKRLLLRVVFIFVFVVFINMVKDKKQLIAPFFAYSIGLIPVMYATIKMHIHFSFNPRVVFNICAPYFNDHTIYGACLAFILPILILILLKRKQFNISGYLLIALSIITSVVLFSELFALSRAAILSLVVALLFGAALKYGLKFKLMIAMFVVSAVLIFSFQDRIYKSIQANDTVSNDGEITNHFSSVTNIQSDASNLERINRWVCAIRMFQERPLVGFGLGTYQFEYNRFQTMANKTYISTNTGDRGNAHSEYLTYLSENGIFGFFIFLSTVFATLYYGMQNNLMLKSGLLKTINLGILLALTTFFFHGIFNSFLDQIKMSALYFSAIGAIIWINQHIKEKVNKDVLV